MGRKRTAAAEPGGASPRWPRVSQGQPSRRPLRTRPRPAREGTRPGRSGTSTSLSWGHSLNKRHPDDRPLHPALFPSGQPGDAIPSCAPLLAYFLFFIAIVYILIYVRLICWHSDSSNLLVQSCPSGCVRQPTLLINNKCDVRRTGETVNSRSFWSSQDWSLPSPDAAQTNLTCTYRF